MITSFRAGPRPAIGRIRTDSPPPAIAPDPTIFSTPQGWSTTPAKTRIIHWPDQQESLRGIQRKLFKHCGVQTSITTIHRVVTSRITRRRKSTGRPLRFTLMYATFARQMIARGFIFRSMPFEAIRVNFLPQFSAKTIQRGLKRWFGMGRLVAARRQYVNQLQCLKSMAFAILHMQYLPQWWERVIWTDEVIVATTRQGRIYITRSAAEIYILTVFNRYSGKDAL